MSFYSAKIFWKNYFIFNSSAKSFNFSAVSRAILSMLVFPFLRSATVDQGTPAPLEIALVLISLFNSFSIRSLIWFLSLLLLVF
nr:MAG TPA: hypothetical protein [Caudoviricetes sp.]